MARAALLTCSGPWDLPTIQGGSEGVRWDQSCQGPPQPLLRRMRRCGLPVSRDFHVVGIKCIKLQRDCPYVQGRGGGLVVNLEGATVGLRSSGHPGCLHRRVAGCQQPTCCWRSCCKGPGFLLSIVLPHLLSGSQSIASTFTCVRRQYCHAWTQPRGCP